ncbi:hypothetical protein [Chitinophaga japonensis]|uniref:Uncharacterized protein n=1 Tax=Chitinophaga japonensis TaxID=104662 RepID=A0A562TCC9_CHIJA|nr:hypothetical protein [Chitinophaga japonensis]TWI90938.1 hypothetical protein LX66_0299 [Chitinophaga japonensis]
MKANGLILIALFIATTAFAQNAATKHDLQAKANASAGVDAGMNNQGGSAGANVSSAAEMRSAAGVTQERLQTGLNAQGTAEYKQEGAVAGNPKTGVAIGEEVKGSVESGLHTGRETGSHLHAQAVKEAKQVGRQIKNVGADASINAAAGNSLKIKTVPVKVNTLTTAGAGVRIL